MEFRRSGLRVAPFVTMLLLLTACHRQEPSATLEAAVLAGNWEEVEAGAVTWTRSAEFQHQATIILGYATLARGDSAAAVRHFLRARSGGRSRSDMRWAEALAARHPGRAIAQLFAGDALARQDDRRAGLARLDAALTLDPNLAVARVARGMLWAMAGERAAALQDLEVLVVGGPVAAEALVTRGLVYLEAGQLEKALADLNRALELTPEHAVAHNARGILHARRGNWNAATRDFEAAFRLAPELGEARRNWQLAQAAKERGTVISEQWHLGVFGTGIRSEADSEYAKTHARDLVPGREHAHVYLAYKGELPLAGVEKMKQQGIPVIVADPRNPQAAVRELDQFFKHSLDSGKNPVVFSDINKRVPSQLGNQKAEAIDVPAQILAQATKAFYNEVNQRGGTPVSTYAAHSDGTKVEIRAAILAEKLGAPVTRAYVESPRQEAEVEWGLRRAPNTQFTVVQPVRGDLFTSEAQGRFARGEPGAYSQTIEKLKGIQAPNYELALITNPSQASPSLRYPAGAHGDSAKLDRFSQVELYRGGRQIDSRSGFLGQVLGATQQGEPQVKIEINPAKQPGGILVGPVHLARGAGGRVVFESGDHDGGELALVYTLFGSVTRAPHLP